MNSPTSVPLNSPIKTSPDLLLNPGESRAAKRVVSESRFGARDCLASCGIIALLSFLAVALVLKENFFLGRSWEVRVSRLCFKSAMVLREDRTS